MSLASKATRFLPPPRFAARPPLLHVTSVLLLGALLVGVGSCSEKSTSPALERLTLTPEGWTTEIEVGQTVTLQTQVEVSGSGAPVTVALSYASADPTILKVTEVDAETAQATALKPGQTTVTVSLTSGSGTQSASPLSVAVTSELAGVEWVGSTEPLTFTAAGQTAVVRATGLDVDGNPVAGSGLTWSVTGSGAATVVPFAGGDSATVAAEEAGTDTVRVTDPLCAGTCDAERGVKVSTGVARVVVDPSEQTVTAGDSVGYHATALDGNGTEVVGREVRWALSDSSVGTIDSLGVVVGMHTGTADVIARVDTVDGRATVQVEPGAPVGYQVSTTPVAASSPPGPTASGSAGQAPVTRTPAATPSGAPVSASRAAAVSSTVQVTAGTSVTVLAQLVDAFGNPVPEAGHVVTWNSKDEGAFDPATSETDGTGAARTTWTARTTAGDSPTIAATDDSGLSGGETVRIVAGAATTLSFVVEPTDVVMGAPITPAVRVAVTDEYGNPIPTATASITIAVGTNPGGGTLSGTTRVATVNGVATFGDLRIDKPGSGYTLTATASGMGSAGSTPFDVRAIRAFVTNFGSDNLSVIDVSSGIVTNTIPVGSGPAAIAMTPDGSKAYVVDQGGAANSVSVIDVAGAAVTGTIVVGSLVYAVAVTPDGTKVYVTNAGSNTVSVVNVASGTVTSTISVGNFPDGVAVTPDGSKAYVANGNSGTVSVIDVAGGSVTNTIPVGSGPTGVAVTPDGSTVYVTNINDTSVSVIDVASGAVTATISVGGDPTGVAVTPDGAKVYVTNAASADVSAIDVASGTVTNTISVGSGPSGVAVTPDGSTVYVTNAGYGGGIGDTVSVIDVASGTVTATIPVGSIPGGVAIW